MDVVTHGLWGGLFFGKRSKNFKLALLFGILPDLIAFVPHTIIQLMEGEIIAGKPTVEQFPDWVFSLYNTTHSLLVAAILFVILRQVWGKELSYSFLSWPLHILMDIPTHTADFFPTKFLYPLSHLHFNGVSWSHPLILITNYTLLIVGYGIYAYSNRRRRRSKESHM